MIGWIWVVFGGYLLLRGIFDLVLWNALGPLRTSVMAAIRDQAPSTAGMTWLFRNAVWVYALKSAFGGFAFVSAWQLLRLRPAARLAMQAVGWMQIAYALSFAVFWSWLWPKVAEARAHDPAFTAHSYGAFGLVAGLAVCALMVSAVAAQILTLRSPRVRAAFAGATAPTRA